MSYYTYMFIYRYASVICPRIRKQCDFPLFALGKFQLFKQKCESCSTVIHINLIHCAKKLDTWLSIAQVHYGESPLSIWKLGSLAKINAIVLFRNTVMV